MAIAILEQHPDADPETFRFDIGGQYPSVIAAIAAVSEMERNDIIWTIACRGGSDEHLQGRYRGNKISINTRWTILEE